MSEIPPIETWFSGPEDTPFSTDEQASAYLRELVRPFAEPSPDYPIHTLDPDTLTMARSLFSSKLPEIKHYGDFNKAVHEIYKALGDTVTPEDFKPLYDALKIDYECVGLD